MSNTPIIQPIAATAPYHGPEVCDLTGVTYRQLDYWARTDLVRPSVADAKGSGSQRLYDDDDVALIRLVKRCIDAGTELRRIRIAMPALRDVLQREGETLLVIAADGKADVARDSAELLALIARHHTVVVLVCSRSAS